MSVKKYTIELDENNQEDEKIIDFIEGYHAQLKMMKIGKGITKENILRLLLDGPFKKHRDALQKMIKDNLTEESKFEMIYEYYKKSKGLDISVGEFSMKYLGDIGQKERNKIISACLQ